LSLVIDMTDLLDIISISDTVGRQGWVLLTLVIFSYLLTSVIPALQHLENLEIIAEWRRRNELWNVFREYSGIKDALQHLYREFGHKAGFENTTMMRIYFWVPSLFSFFGHCMLITVVSPFNR